MSTHVENRASRTFSVDVEAIPGEVVLIASDSFLGSAARKYRGFYTPKRARKIALAILTAADEAERITAARNGE